MPTVTFLPENRAVVAGEGASILATAVEHGIHLEHACGGFCACTTCHVIIERGADALSEMAWDEEDKLDSCEGLTMKSRLGCQAKLHGDVTVRIPPKPY
jgi:2Fe-2S ferredoxin